MVRRNSYQRIGGGGECRRFGKAFVYETELREISSVQELCSCAGKPGDFEGSGILHGAGELVDVMRKR